MENLVGWLEKRISKLKDKKRMEDAKPTKDIEMLKRIGGKLSGYKEVLAYIKNHI